MCSGELDTLRKIKDFPCHVALSLHFIPQTSPESRGHIQFSKILKNVERETLISNCY